MNNCNVLEEPKFQGQGCFYKPDLVIFKDDCSYIIDITITWDSCKVVLKREFKRKRNKYTCLIVYTEVNNYHACMYTVAQGVFCQNKNQSLWNHIPNKIYPKSCSRLPDSFNTMSSVVEQTNLRESRNIEGKSCLSKKKHA